MPAARLFADKQALALAILSEGTPINAVCRMLKVGKHAVLRVIAETGAALEAYTAEHFKNVK